MKIEEKTNNSTVNIALDTIKIGKQALVFANTKRSAEKAAEEISHKIKEKTNVLEELSQKVLGALSKPTKQCERLAKVIKKGIAFHHAGLVQKQRELIEDNFREGVVKVICCTPTLCLSKDTMIWSNVSETEVSKFKTSNPLFALSKDKLISMKPQKVNRIMNSSKLIQISSVSGYSIKVTPNHNMLIKRKNNKIIIPAKNITKKDKIATIGRLNIKDKSKYYIKDFIKENEYGGNNNKFDSKIAYFIGAMLGDGYSGIEIVYKKIKYKGSPSIVGIDKEIFENVKDVCKALKISCRALKKHNGVPSLVLGKNKWFREFLLNSGVEVKDKKHISEKIMSMDLNNVSSLLKGLFDTDGHVQKKDSIGFSNVSEKLVKQIQKLLLRFGIVSRIRRRKEGTMQVYDKVYKTMPSFEITVHQKKSIFDFYRYVGFNVKRKQDDLKDLVKKIVSNINYLHCGECDYKIYKDLFSGRSKDQKEWGKIKYNVIKLLGERKELGSRELKNILKHEPKKKDSRLNHHYELIKKRRVGSRSKTEWFWSLNEIGKWIFKNIISKGIDFDDFFKNDCCPICENKLKIIVKKGWRDSDFDGDIFWDIIREIKTIEKEDEVYDIVLPIKPKNDHMFVANGFIVHNSIGVDLPAFRAVLQNLKRYGHRGLTYIPTLEYLQMAGRAGRPKFDKYGEAIIIASNDSHKDELVERYIYGEPEDIYSKLAVEPVLRMYVLSLLAAGFVSSKKELFEFFGKTFFAHQFEDIDKIEGMVEKILRLLEEWEFVDGKKDDFVSADEIGDEKYKATLLGKRVAELYIDPLTAHNFVVAIRKATSVMVNEFSFLQMISGSLELRPLLKVKMKEYDKIQEELVKYDGVLLTGEPSIYESEYDEFLNSVKTALFFMDWIDEKDEEYLLEQYDIRPGEISVKLNNADWLLYTAEELTRILHFQPLLKELVKLRIRIKNGVREEVIPLLKLKGVGRVRARSLFRNGIKDIAGIKKVDYMKLVQLLGKKTALSVKEQVGQDYSKIKVKENKRKGQISLKDY